MILGVFDVLEHVNWIKANPHKKPKPIGLRKQISHFYSHGTICDKTGKPRQTEVKLFKIINFKYINKLCVSYLKYYFKNQSFDYLDYLRNFIFKILILNLIIEIDIFAL
jgi:hypothetical protein